jgi:hypothetical protein
MVEFLQFMCLLPKSAWRTVNNSIPITRLLCVLWIWKPLPTVVQIVSPRMMFELQSVRAIIL